MNFAVIPWADYQLGDKLFGIIKQDGTLQLNDGYLADFYRGFVKKKHVIHTVDMYESLSEVDFFLIFPIECWRWTNRLIKLGYENKLIYCNTEPPSVVRRHSTRGYKMLSEVFSRILVRNSDMVDNTTFFLKHGLYIFKKRFSNIPFDERKLLVAISGNKKSRYPGELYSERRNIYYFFEKNYKSQFDLFGHGWDIAEHPCYQGTVDNKIDVYHNYKFAICFENIRGMKDYVTEKILDCICAGVVPIYAGASNISEYIPKECFIEFGDFNNYEDLAHYLLDMKEEEYCSFLSAMDSLLKTDIQKKYSGEQYVEDILKCISSNNTFNISVRGRIYVAIASCWESVVLGIYNIKQVIVKGRRKIDD